MTTFKFEILNGYRNRGQNIEQSIRYALTGEVCKADNKPATLCGDCGDYQIKSARATICKGFDIAHHLKADAAKAYIYGTQDGVAYIMTKAEYKEFAEAFGEKTRESKQNGGAEKIRLRHESKALLNWLAERAA